MIRLPAGVLLAVRGEFPWPRAGNELTAPGEIRWPVGAKNALHGLRTAL